MPFLAHVAATVRRGEIQLLACTKLFLVPSSEHTFNCFLNLTTSFQEVHSLTSVSERLSKLRGRSKRGRGSMHLESREVAPG